MLRENGIAMDDGSAARLATDHFTVTTTTANAAKVYQHMEFVRQCLFPDMDVQLISTTETWAQYAIAGPNSRKLLQKIVDPAFDISNAGFPFMACGTIPICGGLRAQLFRISFSVELAFELAVPARYGDALMRKLTAEGAEFNITPYGTEALGVMRIAKGHAAGNELNGTTNTPNLGYNDRACTAKNGGERMGETPRLVSPMTKLTVTVEVVSAHFIDPEGRVCVHNLTAITALGGTVPRLETAGNLTLTENPDIALANLAARRGHVSACQQHLAALVNSAVPGPGKAVLHHPEAAFWIGPDQWMVGAPFARHEDLAAQLKTRLGDAALVTDQTVAWVCFDLRGDGIEDVMALLCALNVTAMQTGDASRTVIHHLGCFVIRRDPANWVRILGPRASAGSLHHAI
ncbi:MAG: heterotetrameric sarcosine oxidase gamma subunit [Pseudorhodobacter sp.]|jgi:heterotetrameric sarcosine oxidase gamma subunit